MGELINLRRVRKSKQRFEYELQASQNRAHFGRTSAEKKLQAQQSERDNKHLDAHLLPPLEKQPE